jgi:DNA-binding transcriptional LysR family regulator
LVLIAPKDTWSANAALQPFSIDSLANTQLLGITRADQLGRQLQAYLEQLDPPARISTWVQTYQIAKDIVCSGEGLALVDPFTAVSAGAELQTRIVEPVMPIHLYAVYRVDAPLNSVQKAFVSSIKAVASESIAYLMNRDRKLHLVR